MEGADDRRDSVVAGVHRALALGLFESGTVTLTQAARLPGLDQVSFLALLAHAGIPAVDYPPEELEAELAAAL
jgi:predicted HTH domain antitoxin